MPLPHLLPVSTCPQCLLAALSALQSTLSYQSTLSLAAIL